MRISVDEEKDSENTSIENQKKIISDHINANFPDSIVDFYEDRDRSGYTFEQREGYQKMRKGLISGKYDILIIKDFSRFSRRNSRGLAELEDLRDCGIRIISINDNIDYPRDDEWLQIQFRFLMNEMPVTDTSKKVRKVVESRQKDGKWICAAPYGYTMTHNNNEPYKVNEKQAEVIRMIYEMYLSGMGYRSIANRLTSMNIPTPRQDEILRFETEEKSVHITSNGHWSIQTVNKILGNDFYIGTLRQHKTSRAKINGKSIATPESDHIVIKDNHTPIIEKAVFERVQEQLILRSNTGYRGIKKYRTDYTGYLFCGDCGKPMSSMSRPNLAPAYRCSTYSKRGKEYCSSHHVRIDKLDATLKKYVTLLRDNSVMISENLDELLSESNKNYISEDTPQMINAQIKQLKNDLSNVIKQRVKDITAHPEREELINDAYEITVSDYYKKIEGLNSQLDLISKRGRIVKDTSRAAETAVDILDKILDKERLDKSDIGCIVDRINVYEDHLEVQLRADIDDIISAEAERTNPQNHIGTSFDDSVTVVNEGDPLEIFTSADGEVIFKKYSAINEMASSASQVAEVMTRLANCPTVVFDRDHVVAVAGVQKKEFSERRVSRALEEYLESRKNYIRSSSADAKVFPVEGVDQAALACSPILASGDVTGAVAFLAPNDSAVANEVQQNLIQAAAQFLGKQIED